MGVTTLEVDLIVPTTQEEILSLRTSLATLQQHDKFRTQFSDWAETIQCSEARREREPIHRLVSIDLVSMLFSPVNENGDGSELINLVKIG